MRNDMTKIITEDYRRGAGYYNDLPNEYRKAKQFKLDDDLEVDDVFCQRVLPIRSRAIGWEGKESSYNTRPLKRFLLSRVGKKWDDVYSELCSAVKGQVNSAKDLRGLVDWFVEINTFVNDDGKICYNDSYRGDREVDWVIGMYVHPVSGILCKGNGCTYKAIDRKRKVQRDIELKAIFRPINDTLQFHKIDGNWYRVTLGPIDFNEYRADALGVVEPTSHYRENWKEARARACFSKYKVKDVWAIKKETASKKDIRNHNLDKS